MSKRGPVRTIFLKGNQMTSNDNARNLLLQLVQNNAFRARMESDPVTAFAEYGFQIDPAIAPSTVQLPSNQDIEQNIDLLSRQLEASYGWIVFSR